MTDIAISNNPTQHRYEATIDGQLAGYCEYNLLKEAIMFTHTEVLEAFEGKGVGSAIARHVLDDARAQGVHVIPVCQFIAGYIRKRSDYAVVVRGHMRRAFKI